MKNPRLYYLLKQLGLSPQKIADDPRVLSSRAHVTECLLNKPGRGKNTRKRIVGMLLNKFPKTEVSAAPRVRVQTEHDVVQEILQLLGWDEKGNLVLHDFVTRTEAGKPFVSAVPRGEPQLERVLADGHKETFQRNKTQNPKDPRNENKTKVRRGRGGTHPDHVPGNCARGDFAFSDQSAQNVR